MTGDSGNESADEQATTAVSARRRRFLLDCLHQFDEPVSLPDLADEVAERERGEPLSTIPGERVKDVYLSLYHRHVPALADAGVVEYDQDADLVRVPDDVDIDPHRGPQPVD